MSDVMAPPVPAIPQPCPSDILTHLFALLPPAGPCRLWEASLGWGGLVVSPSLIRKRKTLKINVNFFKSKPSSADYKWTGQLWEVGGLQ